MASVARRVRARLQAPLPWIAVLGPDGSGKSTLIRRLQEQAPAHVGPVVTYHWRPHAIDRVARSVDPVTDPHGRPPRSAVSSVTKLVWIAANWWIGWPAIARQRANGSLVVFDRHYLDLLVDPRRYRYGGPTRVARAVAALIPQPDLIFVLDAPTPTLQSRKAEVAQAETERQRVAYRHLAARLPDAVTLDARQRPEDNAQRVIAEVRRWLSRRNARWGA